MFTFFPRLKKLSQKLKPKTEKDKEVILKAQQKRERKNTKRLKGN